MKITNNLLLRPNSETVSKKHCRDMIKFTSKMKGLTKSFTFFKKCKFVTTFVMVDDSKT